MHEFINIVMEYLLAERLVDNPVEAIVLKCRASMRMSPQAINNGWCWGFAVKLAKILGAGAEVVSTTGVPFPGHSAVLYRGRYYDAESPEGVKDLKDLAYCRRMRAIADSEGIVESVEPETMGASVAVIERLRPQMAAAAQSVYDEWTQDEDGYDEELGSGGICHLIADKVQDVLIEHGVDCQTVSSTMEVHVYMVARCPEGVFEIDIPHRLYERGGGYTWTKVPGVKFTPQDIVVACLDANPDRYHLYMDS